MGEDVAAGGGCCNMGKKLFFEGQLMCREYALRCSLARRDFPPFLFRDPKNRNGEVGG